MTQLQNAAKDFSDGTTGFLSPHERKQYERLAREIREAHSIGTRKENQIGSESFPDEDKRRIVTALERAARYT